MIDLDKAQIEAAEDNGWDALLRLSGHVIQLRHPSRIQARDVRSGIVPALGKLIVRVWRLVFGGSEIAALRREMLGSVEKGDTAGLAAVRGFGLWELVLMHRAYQEATARLGRRVALAGLAKAVGPAASAVTVEGPLNGPSTAVRAAAPTAMDVQGQHGTLTPGGGRLPGLMGGGLWGKAKVDADPAWAAKQLEERMVRDRAALEQIRAAVPRNTQGEPAEVTNGG